MSIKEIMSWFGFTSVAQFNKEWKELTEKDKAELKQGLSDGSLTY